MSGDESPTGRPHHQSENSGTPADTASGEPTPAWWARLHWRTVWEQCGGGHSGRPLPAARFGVPSVFRTVRRSRGAGCEQAESRRGVACCCPALAHNGSATPRPPSHPLPGGAVRRQRMEPTAGARGPDSDSTFPLSGSHQRVKGEHALVQRVGAVASSASLRSRRPFCPRPMLLRFSAKLF